MATSGSIDFSKNAGNTARLAMKLINVLDAYSSSVPAQEMNDALDVLNLMLKEWQVMGPNVWRATEGSIALVSNTASYAMSPRPLEIYSVRYRDANGRDLPMEELTREEYDELPLKTSNGIPTTYFVDKQIDGSTIYTWPVLLTATTETLRVTYQRVVEDVDAQQNDIDVPQEALPLVTYCLAARLADLHGDNTPAVQRVIARSEQMLQQYQAFDREAVVRFEPGYY